MKNIWLLTKMNVKRNRFAVILSIIGAIMLCLIIYLIKQLETDHSAASVSIGVIDHDNSTLSQDFKRYLSKDLGYLLREKDTYDKLSMQLIDKDISIIIEIPDHFKEQYLSGKSEDITVTSLDDYENAAFVEAYINSYLSSIQTLSVGAAGKQKVFDHLLTEYPSEKLTLTKTSAVSRDVVTHQSEFSGFINSVGFFLMFVFSISIIIAFMVVDDRNKGVYNRIQITPVKPYQYIIGTEIFGMVLCILLYGLFTLYIYIKDIYTGVPIGVILLLMTLYSLFTIGFSLMVALSTKSKSAITVIIMGISTIGCILGGAYFPVDMAPKALQNLAKILPQYWFMDVFRRIQVSGSSSVNIYPNIIILLLFVLLSFLIGAVLFSKNKTSN